MSEELPRVTDLSTESISEMQRLEREMGVILLAWYRQPIQFAKLDDDQIEKLRGLEESLRTTIIAYTPIDE